MAVDSTSMGDAAGPNASMEGDATEQSDLVRQGGGLALGGSVGGVPVGAPMPQQRGQGGQQPLPPRQPTAQGPPQLNPQAAPSPQQQRFALPPPYQQQQPWRRRLVRWGNDPGNYPSLKALARLSQMDEQRSGLYRSNGDRHALAAAAGEPPSDRGTGPGAG